MAKTKKRPARLTPITLEALERHLAMKERWLGILPPKARKKIEAETKRQRELLNQLRS